MIDDSQPQLTSWPLVPAAPSPSGHAKTPSLAVRGLRPKRRLALVSPRLAGTCSG